MAQRKQCQCRIGPTPSRKHRTTGYVKIVGAMNRAIGINHTLTGVGAHTRGAHVVVASDGMIATACIRSKSKLLTFDNHFKSIEKLELVLPLK